MDKKSVTETAADAATVVVGIAAMAVDALMGADQAAKRNGSGNGDVGRQETVEPGATDQPASEIKEDRNSPEMPQPQGSGTGGSGHATATSARRSEVTGDEAEVSSGTIDINKAKFDELMSLKHIGRGRAKRIMASRPFRSVEDLASQGIVPADTLAELRNRLAV
jgi:DNA uptake protein ComE-like DNA-binding protein